MASSSIEPPDNFSPLSRGHALLRIAPTNQYNKQYEYIPGVFTSVDYYLIYALIDHTRPVSLLGGSSIVGGVFSPNLCEGRFGLSVRSGVGVLCLFCDELLPSFPNKGALLF